MQLEPLWLRPLMPVAGSNENELYAAIGRVISQWSDVEAGICVIYQLLVGRLFDRSAVLEYGAGYKFRDRLGIIREAARRFFILHPDQDHEGDLFRLLDRVEEFAAHRNDVAHAAVRPWEWVGPTSGGAQTFTLCLLPAHFDPKRFTDNKPDFVYDASALESLNAALLRLTQNTAMHKSDWWLPDGRLKRKGVQT